jgi:prolyl-tRNA editing enzyme YbaK/EbsC (Cys-tRNA(Pro) deacylase)
MRQYEDKLKGYMDANHIQAEHLTFQESCHSVKEAAAAVSSVLTGATAEAVAVTPKDFIKSICLIDSQGELIVGIVKGEDWASLSRIGQAIGQDAPRLALPDEILNRTGYVCGGVPAFGYPALFLIDDKVMKKVFVYTGGGSEYSLVRIAPSEIQRVNGGRIVKIRE